MSFIATNFILPYVGTDKVLKIQNSTLLKVGGFNVCQYIKSATEAKELIIFTSLGQLVLDFATESDAKLAQNLLNVAIESLVSNCSIGGGGGTQDLASVLAIGNNTMNQNIVSEQFNGLLTVADTYIEFSWADALNRLSGANTGLVANDSKLVLNWTDTSVSAALTFLATEATYAHSVRNVFDTPNNNFPQETADTLAYFDTDQNLKSITIGSGLDLTAGTLSATSSLSGTTNYIAQFISGTAIGDGTWMFTGNDILPVTTGSNIGDATHRIGTIFMASIFDYADDVTFYNGVDTTVILTTTGLLGIGTVTPGATLDVKPSGSGTVGININTSSTQDSILTFGTNNSTYGGYNFRGKIYVKDSDQTLNVYTNNSDTIFWNGNGGGVQVKTLTLFTNTTAKFESYLGINIAPSNQLDILNTPTDTSYPIYINSTRTDLTRLFLNNSGGVQTDIQISNFGGASAMYLQALATGSIAIDNRSSGDLLFTNTGVEKVRFTANGLVGIGTATPAELLEVNGNLKLTTTSSVFKIGAYNALSITQSAGGCNIIIGHGNTMNDADNGGGIVIGTFATSSSDGIAIGLASVVALNTTDGIAIGREATVNNSAIRGIAIGRQALSSNDNAIAIGNYTTASQANTIIIGNNSVGPKPFIGIGTSTPTANFHVYTNSNSSSAIIRNDQYGGLEIQASTIAAINLSDHSGVSTMELWGYHGAGGVIKVKDAFGWRNKNNNQGIAAVVNVDTNPNWVFAGAFGNALTLSDTRFRIIGEDTTSSNYALKVDNFTSSPLLYARNDGEIGMNGFTIRQLSNYTIFKTSGTNGYLFNNAADNTNLARLTNSGVLILNAIASLNSNVGLSVKAQGVSDATKEYIVELYKGSTNNTGITVASKEGVSYIQGTTSANGQTVDLILGGYDGAGNQLETAVFKSNGNTGIGTINPLTKFHVDGGSDNNVQIYLKSTGVDNGIQIDSGAYPFFNMKSNGVNNLTIQGIGASIIAFRPGQDVEWRATDSNTSMYGSVNMNVAATSFSYYMHGLSVGKSTVPDAKLEIFDSSLSIQKWSYNSINKGAIFLTPNAAASLGISTLFNDKLTFGRFNVSGSANGFGFVLEATSGDFTISPDYTGNIDFIYKRSNQNFGFNISSPTAKVHIKGIDSTASNYALKIDNSASSSLLHVRNDNYIFMGDNLSNYVEFDIPNGNMNAYFANYVSLTSGNSVIDMIDAGSGFSIRNFIEGNFQVIDYNTAADLFGVTSSGKIYMPLLPTSNAGLSTGELYVDTAANILANGDKVVGWKV